MAKQNVLIVEDDHFLSDIYSHLLEEKGIQVKVAKNGKEGLKEFKDNIFSLVMTDLIMPQMNGFDFLRELQALNTKKVPTVVLSNLGQEKDRETCKQLGVSMYLVKTQVDISDVVRMVTNQLSASKTQDTPSAAAESATRSIS